MNDREDGHRPDAPVAADEPGAFAVVFGARVRSLRGDRSLKAFAAELGGVSAGHLCEVENGKARPSRRLVERLDEVGGTSGATRLEGQYPELLKEWDAKKEARRARRRQLAEESRERASGQTTTKRTAGEYPERAASPGIGAGEAAGTREDEVNRRDAFKTMAALLLGGAARAQRLLRSAERSNVGRLTLAEYDEAVEWLTRNAGVRPLTLLVDRADKNAAEVADLLLDGRHSGKQRMHLESLTGQLSYLQGDFAFRLGDYEVAGMHLRVARHYGEQLDNHLLIASVANVETYLALYQGRYGKALDLVREAQEYATEHRTARLAALEARALSGSGPEAHSEIMVLLDRAEAALPSQPTFEPGAVAPFGPEMYVFYAAAASARAGHPRAEEFAREGVRQYEALEAQRSERFHFEHLALARLDLATALVKTSVPDPRESARLAISALAVPRLLQTDPVKRRARELLLLMSSRPAWRDLPTTRELSEAVRGYRPAALPPPPVRRGLPGR